MQKEVLLYIMNVHSDGFHDGFFLTQYVQIFERKKKKSVFRGRFQVINFLDGFVWWLAQINSHPKVWILLQRFKTYFWSILNLQCSLDGDKMAPLPLQADKTSRWDAHTSTFCRTRPRSYSLGRTRMCWPSPPGRPCPSPCRTRRSVPYACPYICWCLWVLLLWRPLEPPG